MQRFVQLKHYAIFLLVFIVPFSILFLLVSLARNFDIPVLRTIGPMLFVIIIVGWFAWIYSAGVMLYAKLPTPHRMSLKRFKVFLFTPCIYFFCFLGMLTYFARVSKPGPQSPGETIAMLIAGIGYFFSIFCVLYSFYFVSKCLKSIQRKRVASFKEYVGDFFLFWILPVGIWFLQPKINKIFSEDEYELGSGIPAQQ